MKNTDFKIGESACRCGETNFQEIDPALFLKEVEKAGGLELKDEPEDEGLDWYRSEPTPDSDYEELFDQDQGSN